jgi:hypothetical protein
MPLEEGEFLTGLRIPHLQRIIISAHARQGLPSGLNATPSP